MSDITSAPADSTTDIIVNVFTHSSTGFPGAWTEDEIDVLLDVWNEVLESSKSPRRRSYIAFKILRRLRKRGFRRVEKDDVRKQMATLQTEYNTYMGLQKIGIAAAKADCFPKLEKIFSRTTRRQQTTSTSVDVASEESDHSGQLTAGESTEEHRQNREDNGVTENADQMTEDEGGNRRRQPLRRPNFRRLIQQQQATLKLIASGERARQETNEKIERLLSEIVELQRQAVNVQEHLAEMLQTLKVEDSS